MLVYLLVLSFFYFLYRLIKNIGKTFPIFELTVVLYLLQYGIAPLLEYNYNSEHTMSLGKEEYLSFAIFACLAFGAGMLSIKNRFEFNIADISPSMASSVGRMLILIGLGSSLAMSILPESLQSIVNFFILFKIIGIYCLIFSGKKFDRVLVVVFSLEIAVGAILGGLLIEFIVFSIFFAMFYGLRYKISNFAKVIFIAGSLTFLTVYQGVKAEYRLTVWEEKVDTATKIALLGNLINYESFTASLNTDISNNESLIQTIHRLNQGWQTSMVLKHVPAVVDFENGQEFINDVLSSIMPRALWPDKRIVNDYERFNYYTGYSLNRGTAMSMGVLGDFYLNFGFYGTLVALFFFGYFLAKVFWWFYYSYIMVNPLNLIWIPFIFSYLIRPGNEFYMVLNHLIKAFIIFFLIHRFVLSEIRKKYLPVTI